MLDCYRDDYGVAFDPRYFPVTPEEYRKLTNNGTDQQIMVKTTHEELKSLRDNNILTPGQLYRITDYVATTTQEGTRSAGHAFDIIVMALSNSELSEEAKAIAHSGDTHFANCELSAWELKYCLDNDTNRFAWADETNGKGVIYYMKDEWNNECPYDFKNIQFKRYAITNVSTTGYTQDETSALSETFLFRNNGNKCFATKDVYGNWVPSNSTDSQNASIVFFLTSSERFFLKVKVLHLENIRPILLPSICTIAIYDSVSFCPKSSKFIGRNILLGLNSQPHLICSTMMHL